MAIVAGRTRGRHRLLRALLCTAPALCAGCGSSFEEGDEAWIRVPGGVLLLDEYIVVEVDRFTDRGVEVEPSGWDWGKHTPYSLIRSNISQAQATFELDALEVVGNSFVLNEVQYRTLGVEIVSYSGTETLSVKSCQGSDGCLEAA